MDSERGELWQALTEINKSIAELSHELTQLRIDIALLSSRQNSTIHTSKKKLIGSLALSRH